MKNNGIADFLKPTIITGQQYGTKVSVEIDHSDTDIDELMDAFHTLVIGMGYSESSWKQAIMDMGDEFRDEEFDKNYSFDFPESYIDEALAEHNQIEDADTEYGDLYHSTDNFEDYQNKNEDDEYPEPNEALKKAAEKYKKSVKVGRRGVKKSK
jgi:hypothetical protein